MFVLEAKIQIGKYTFYNIHEVEITKSVEDLADTALIKLPTKFKVKGENTEIYTEEAIQPGDEVVIQLGYEGHYFGVEFTGWVSKVSPKTPMEIQCEDNIWKLRRKNIKKAWNKGVTLKELLQEIVSGTGVALAPNIPDMVFDKMIIDDANGAQVLQKIKEDYCLSVFIDDNQCLYAGLQQLSHISQTVIYDLNYNLIENNLEFRKAEEKRLKIRYTYIDKANKRKTIEVGDADGEVRTFHTSVVSGEDELKKMALAEIGKLKYDGYDGDVTSFLMPFATRGMTAKIIDKEHKNRTGKYFIKSVKTSYSTSGARRKIKIGNKL